MAAGGAQLSESTLNLYIAIGALIMIIYTMLGGFFAVAWTDFIQGLWALLGFALVIGVAASKLGNPLDALAGIRVPDTNITYVDIHNFWGYEYTGALLLVIILSYISIGFGWPGNPHITVRYMAIRSTRDIPKAAFTALALLLVIYYLAMSAGWFTRVAITRGVMSDDLVQLVQADPEFSFPALTMQFLPPFLAGLVLAAPVALMMSTADSQLLVATSAIVEDIYRRTFKAEMPEEKLVLISRLVTFILGILALIWALFFEKSVYYFVLFSWGGLGAALGSVTLLSVLDRKMTASGAFAGLITGAAGIIIWKSYSKGWIFWPNGDPNGALPLLYASVPLIVLILGFLGMLVLERDAGKAAIGAVTATIVSAVFWVAYAYARYKIDPTFSGWWYELLVAFPMAVAVILATSRVTTPPPEDEIERIARLFKEPAPSEKVQALAVTEFEVIKGYLRARGAYRSA